METKQARTMLAAMLLLGGMLVYALTATGGSLEPNAPPEPTMKTLQEIYDAVVSQGSGVSQREGDCRSIAVSGNSTETLFTVEAGKRFVLLKLYAHHTDSLVYSRDWRLTVNDIELIHGRIVRGGGELVLGSGWEYIYKLEQDFPDRCVVVNAGETLKVVNLHAGTLYMTLIGYSYDVP